MSRVLTASGRLNAKELAENLFHDPIIRIDYPMFPYGRGELPHVEIISGSHQYGSTSDENQRLLVWEQQEQWDVGDKLPSNDIYCWDFSAKLPTCIDQMQAVLDRWSDHQPAWLQNQNLVVTIDGERVEGRRDDAHVTLALIPHLSRLYEGLRAEIIYAQVAGIRHGRTERLVETPYFKRYLSLGMVRTEALDSYNMRNICQALRDLISDYNRQVADEIEYFMGDRPHQLSPI